MNINTLKSKYLTTEQACARLNITPARLRQLRLNGTVTGIQLGARLWWYEPKEIDKYLKERRPAGRPVKAP